MFYIQPPLPDSLSWGLRWKLMWTETIASSHFPFLQQRNWLVQRVEISHFSLALKFPSLKKQTFKLGCIIQVFLALSDAHTISSTLHSKMINIKWCNQKKVVLQLHARPDWDWFSAEAEINPAICCSSFLKEFYIEMYHHKELLR